ncbi:hypothetical protein [Streptomyces sp. NPDC001292]|uniref:hypothetical protein n=1 Tax=Streptomyces sp. NPDC001292 TaxID=3364558 RepID=UPI0036796F35
MAASPSTGSQRSVRPGQPSDPALTDECEALVRPTQHRQIELIRRAAGATASAQRLGALLAALLRTMADHKLKTCITFHHRTVEAQAYAEGLERVTGKLHADQPEKYPKRIWADWLCGEHVPEHRRQVLGGFGTTARRTVLSRSCRGNPAPSRWTGAGAWRTSWRIAPILPAHLARAPAVRTT